MTNLSHPQSELLKYLHSQISATQSRIDSDVHFISLYIDAKEIEPADMQPVIEYEINKLQSKVDALNFRLKWLVEQLNQFAS